MLDAKDYQSNRPPAEHCVHPAFWVAAVPLEQACAAAVGSKDIALEAVANQGRWLVECPDCHGAQLTAPEDPRFMCCECANAAVGGLWRPVVWPKHHAKIAELLDERPGHARNWTPGETLRDLKAENIERMGV